MSWVTALHAWAPTRSREHLRSRAVLAPKNVDVDAFNLQLLEKFPAESMREYTSSDTISGMSPEDYGNYPVEFLNSLELSGLLAHKLRLCPGAVVILLRNIDSPLGLCSLGRTSAPLRIAYRVQRVSG